MSVHFYRTNKYDMTSVCSYLAYIHVVDLIMKCSIFKIRSSIRARILSENKKCEAQQYDGEAREARQYVGERRHYDGEVRQYDGEGRQYDGEVRQY